VVRTCDHKSTGTYRVHLQSPATILAIHPFGISVRSMNLMRVVVCPRLDCNEIGLNACAACLHEYYCSRECQVEDWKDHKKLCHLMKQLSNEQQPFPDVCSMVEKILEKTEVKIANLGKEKYLKLLKHTATFAEHQVGIPITGNRPYTRDWKDDRIDNWKIEINLLLDIYIVLGAHIFSFYDGDNSQDYCISSISYFQKSLA
jgi:hypothetical protein